MKIRVYGSGGFHEWIDKGAIEKLQEIMNSNRVLRDNRKTRHIQINETRTLLWGQQMQE